MNDENDIDKPKRGRGRPRIYANEAERQQAYRDRLKETGKRVITRVVRDVREDVPLQSDIIDLSAVEPQASPPQPIELDPPEEVIWTGFD